jgi:Fe-Mn family superoxide dismutase
MPNKFAAADFMGTAPASSSKLEKIGGIMSTNNNVINRRKALRQIGIGALAIGSFGRLQARQNESRADIALPLLPYAMDALEPHIDTVTMQTHHGKHHAGYTRKFKAAVETLGKRDEVEAILAGIPALPEDMRRGIRNNGGGYWNHSLFWQIMAPAGQGGGGKAGGKLGRDIERGFGSFEQFQEAFSKAASGQFGSGWAWLVARPDGSLIITATANQDNPLMTGIVHDDQLGTPLMGIDVWEHAYYLKYKNMRGEYIKNWWQVVNWPFIEERYAAL